MAGIRRGKWTKKTNPESCRYIVESRACDIPVKDVIEGLRTKFGFTLTPVRINDICGSKKWLPIYNVAREQYLKESRNNVHIALAAKQHRLQGLDKLAGKFEHSIDRIGTFIDNLEISMTMDKDGLTDANVRSLGTLMNILNNLAKTYTGFLKHAKDETEPKNTNNQKNGKGSGSTSFLFNLNVDSSKAAAKKVTEVPDFREGAVDISSSDVVDNGGK